LGDASDVNVAIRVTAQLKRKADQRLKKVSLPLLLTGRRMAEDARTENTTKFVATHWVAGTDYEVQYVNANQDDVTVIIVGHGTAPSFADLELGLRTA